MKTIRNILALGVLSIALTASAQTTTHKTEKVNIDKGIDDNGKTLRIKISGTKGDKLIKFDRTYNIKGMSKMQKDSIIKHVTDSLGLNQ